MMVLAFAGALTPLLVCLLAALTGIVRPSDMGLRGALIAETMPFDRLTSAMSISRTTSDSARIAGALVGAGLFAAFGMGPAYVAIAGFYLRERGIDLVRGGGQAGIDPAHCRGRCVGEARRCGAISGRASSTSGTRRACWRSCGSPSCST